MSRYYSHDEGEEMEGKIVQCDESLCDGKPCGYMHNKPHEYDDYECFACCEHSGHSGFCVEVQKG